MFGFLVSAVSSIVTAIKAIVPVLKAVANVVMSICQTLGLIKPEEKVEDLGDKAIQAELIQKNQNAFHRKKKWRKRWKYRQICLLKKRRNLAWKIT